MSQHIVDLSWRRGEHEFTYPSYSRDHTWTFDGGDTVTASANPAYLGSEAAVDPEEAFVAALASCHMLTFLVIAAKKRFVVNTYDDQAVGVMAKNEAGRLAITTVMLAADRLRGRRARRRDVGPDAPPGPRPVLHRELGHHTGHRRPLVTVHPLV